MALPALPSQSVTIGAISNGVVPVQIGPETTYIDLAAVREQFASGSWPVLFLLYHMLMTAIANNVDVTSNGALKTFIEGRAWKWR
jgi:hypothetical protein